MGTKSTKITKTEARILLLGLDGVGKTRILYWLKLGEDIATIPTIGFNVENLDYKNLNLTAWDIGGQAKIRDRWQLYYDNTDAIIYVVDSIDRDRMPVANEEFLRILREDKLRDAIVLVLANKQDQPNAMPVDEITKSLCLNSLRNRKWFIKGTNATTGDGLNEGLDWLVKQL